MPRLMIITLGLALLSTPVTGEGPLALDRSFAMGFTPFPYDATEEAVGAVYDLLAEHGDLVSHHLDGGVPWPEALAGEPYHPNVEAELERRLARRDEVERVLLSVTPLDGARAGLATYWGESTGLPLPPPWDRRGFDHPQVAVAFLAYCRDLIGRFEPDAFVYAIEADLVARQGPEVFGAFLELADEVYGTLGAEYPELPVLLSLNLDTEASFYERREEVDALLERSDWIALSTYPYTVWEYRGRPARIPDDWFTRFRALAPEKPFAITETGYAAEDLELPSLGVTIPGRPKWQRRYAKRLLREANALDAELVVWWLVVDFDALWAQLPDDIAELAGTWRDIGLYDEELESRPALRAWDRWRDRRLALADQAGAP